MTDDFKTRLAMANYYQEIADGNVFGEPQDEAGQLVQEDIQAYAQAKLAELFGEAPSFQAPRRSQPTPPPAPVRAPPSPVWKPGARRQLFQTPAAPVAAAPAPARRQPGMIIKAPRAPVPVQEEVQEPEEEVAQTLPQDGEIRTENGQDWRYTWHQIHLDQIEGDTSPLTDIDINGVGDVEGKRVYRAAEDTWWWIRKRSPTARSKTNPATSWDKATIEGATYSVSSRAAALGGSMSGPSLNDALYRDPKNP
jgi:hypothetical protein